MLDEARGEAIEEGGREGNWVLDEEARGEAIEEAIEVDEDGLFSRILKQTSQNYYSRKT